MIFSIWNIWILQKQPRYKDLTIMLPRWYLLGYRPNSAQISNITSVWNKRELNIKFKRPMKACFLRCCFHKVCRNRPRCAFSTTSTGFPARGHTLSPLQRLCCFQNLSYDKKIISISHRYEDQMITPLLVVVLGLHLSNQVARHHVGLVVLPLMVPV